MTLNLFLQDVEEVGMPDLDQKEAVDLNHQLKYCQSVKLNLMEGFCTECLDQLQLHTNKINFTRSPLEELLNSKLWDEEI